MLRRLRCPHTGCSKSCRGPAALTKHVRYKHSQANRISRTPSPHLRTPPHLTANASSPGHSSNGQPEGLQPEPHLPPLDEPAAPQAGQTPSRTHHPHLRGDICDAEGRWIPPDSEPPPPDATDNPWAPFEDKAQFELADLLYRKVEMSATNQDDLFGILQEMNEVHGHPAPFVNRKDMYNKIDAIPLGDVPWKRIYARFPGVVNDDDAEWKKDVHEIWYRNPDTVLRNILANPDFDGEFDYSPYVELDQNGERCWTDFMSANYAWEQSTAVYHANPAETDGAMFVPIITGSDKTTVSVATGQVEYHPGYISIGNIHNNVRRAHRNAVVPFIFFPIPPGARKYDNDPQFRAFKKQLHHHALSAVLRHIKDAMSVPVVRRCPDGHFRRVIFGIGPVISDYPEQVLQAGIVQGWCPKCTALPQDLDNREDAVPRTREYTDGLVHLYADDPQFLRDMFGIDSAVVPFTNDFPLADIHETLSPDLLHQVIKGTFKDHLVEWVLQYLVQEHGKARGEAIMDIIDHRIAAVPPFPGLRHFPQGRRFKQWTGDDSKALMKVYLPVLVDYVPLEVLNTFSSFLDFCYLARRTRFNETTLANLDARLRDFQEHREIFRTEDVRSNFSLPRQHALTHYRYSIQRFGAPYGLCSSITESRHITAVKKPWRRSNRYNALGQMLLTNQRLDKLQALRTDLVARGLLTPTHDKPTAPKPTTTPDDDDNDAAAVDDMVQGSVVLAKRKSTLYPEDLDALAAFTGIPNLRLLTQRLLYDQLHPSSFLRAEDVPDNDLPDIYSSISVFPSAVATFYAPSDLSGRYGMYSERLRCNPNWHKQGPRYDCAFVVEDESQPGLLGMSVVRLRLLFSFSYDGTTYPCAAVEWFKPVLQQPEPRTGLWIVEPDLRGRRQVPFISVIHVNSILRAAHLIPVFPAQPLPSQFKYQYSLDSFRSFFVNKYVDYHAFELLS